MTTAASRAPMPRVGDPSGLESDWRIYPEELQLAFRNHSLMLEGLRYDRTPTGLHYTLTHYDVPHVEHATYQLSVRGLVERQLSLSLPELQKRPAKTLRVTLQCAGDGRGLLRPRPVAQPWQVGAVGTADWHGTPLRRILQEAGLLPAAREVVFTGFDRGIEADIEQDYQRGLVLAEAMRDEVLLAWSMNDAPLEPQHGSPVRLVVPGWYGMTSIKWLRSIEVIGDSFTGYQNARAYRYSQSREESGEPVTLMRVRSLMIPPGIPDFMTRTRVLPRGRVELRGRAWSGRSAIARVEISADGGWTWETAEVEPQTSAHAWQGWRYVWDASQPGTYELCCRATDTSGDRQPTWGYWTARGMGNNAVHRVQVMVD
jgi:DMSO/TMAO reductase YedYZ molybdopterin-dependent catalytic subunit